MSFCKFEREREKEHAKAITISFDQRARTHTQRRVCILITVFVVVVVVVVCCILIKSERNTGTQKSVKAVILLINNLSCSVCVVLLPFASALVRSLFFSLLICVVFLCLSHIYVNVSRAHLG